MPGLRPCRLDRGGPGRRHEGARDERFHARPRRTALTRHGSLGRRLRRRGGCDADRLGCAPMTGDAKPLTYAAAGVDIDAKMGAVARAKDAIRSTFTKGVVGDVVGFGGLFRPDFAGMSDPLLVASADGAGSKLKVAIAAGIHGTVGQDLVNHCVNDILVQGASPLFFLDYIATGKMRPEIVGEILQGLAKACRENGCALLGGETAEMPGMYAAGDYDLAGT